MPHRAPDRGADGEDAGRRAWGGAGGRRDGAPAALVPRDDVGGGQGGPGLLLGPGSPWDRGTLRERSRRRVASRASVGAYSDPTGGIHRRRKERERWPT